MRLERFCNLIWAASIARGAAEQETDVDTYLAFTYVKDGVFL